MNNNGNQTFDISTDGYFVVQRKIISDVYKDMDPYIFKLYLYLCKNVDIKYKKVKKAKTEMMKDLNFKRYYVDKYIDWLHKNYFIQRTNANKHQMYQTKILTAPDYDPYTQTFYSCKDIQSDLGNLKNHNHGYIMLPHTAIKDAMLINKSRYWGQMRMKTWLLLYAHCWLQFFGGIDPDKVSIDQNGYVSLNKGFSYNLKSSLDSVIKVIIKFIKDGFLKPVRCIYQRGIYKGDYGLVTKDKYDEERIVLRPYYLRSKKVEKLYLEGRKMIT